MSKTFFILAMCTTIFLTFAQNEALPELGNNNNILLITFETKGTSDNTACFYMNHVFLGCEKNGFNEVLRNIRSLDINSNLTIRSEFFINDTFKNIYLLPGIIDENQRKSFEDIMESRSIKVVREIL